AENLVTYHSLCLLHKVRCHAEPEVQAGSLATVAEARGRDAAVSTRQDTLLHVPRSRTEMGKRRFTCRAPAALNSLPSDLPRLPPGAFGQRLRRHLLEERSTGVPGLRLIDSQFPSHVLRGSSFNISCDYDANGQQIYQVKWYKGEQEFYRYNPAGKGRTFDTPGVNVNVDRATSRSVLLEGADRATEGVYGCEVTVEQSFDTVIAAGQVTVVDLPQGGPVIRGLFLDSMDEGDRVWVNCTSYRSRPAAQLTWYINGARPDVSLLRHYPAMVDENDLQTVTLGLDFRLRGSHFGSTGLVMLKCTAEIETVFYQSANVRIVSRTMAMRSPFGSGSTYRPLVLQIVLAALASCFLWLHDG
ncbi:uncharacterized protein LOC122375969, partial [Amphibalanus amphitrite]|uniref:uncharacterized protein LOC122375969 n=1 Tax=Amphibalanus amphitrite TaxID=1232801 RepID=UPI001C90029D